MRFIWVILSVWYILISCAAALASPKPVETTQISSRQAVTAASPVVRAILKNYRLVSSLSFVATITGRRGGPVATKTSGSGPIAMKARYAFWGDGARYRVNYSVISPTFDIAKNCQIAFDGRRFQELTEFNHCLFIDYKQPTNSTNLTPVNPALEPVIFLIPFWPYLDLGAHRLTLWHLQQPESTLMPVFWRRFRRGGRIIHGHDRTVSTLIVPAGVPGALSSFWRQIPHGGHLPRVHQSSLSALLFPPNVVGGIKGFSYTVTLSQRLGYMPLRIQVIDRLGKSVETIECHYRAFKVGRASMYIPSRIEKVFRGWGQLPSEKVTIRLRHIVVGGSPPPNIFVIDFHLANIVVDGRTKKVIPVPEAAP